MPFTVNVKKQHHNKYCLFNLTTHLNTTILYVTSLNKHDFLIDQIKISKNKHQFKNRLKIFLRNEGDTDFLDIKMRHFAARILQATQVCFKYKVQSE